MSEFYSPFAAHGFVPRKSGQRRMARAPFHYELFGLGDLTSAGYRVTQIGTGTTPSPYGGTHHRRLLLVTCPSGQVFPCSQIFLPEDSTREFVITPLTELVPA